LEHIHSLLQVLIPKFSSEDSKLKCIVNIMSTMSIVRHKNTTILNH